MTIYKSAATVLAGMLIAINLNAAPALAQGNDRGPKGGPPAEAFTACEGKSEGDAASFSTAKGETITGTCRKDRKGDRLLLVPDNAPEHGRPEDNN